MKDDNMAVDPNNPCHCAPVDLPPSIAAAMQQESIGNIQANNREGRDSFTVTMGVINAYQAKKFGQLDAVESRAVSGVLGTPIAGPTNPQAAPQ